ncbi:MAG TPA: hypothetical protein DCQ94_16865 [Nitrospira sp.]|nr:hypothetical protein [Nitrospira sp.]
MAVGRVLGRDAYSDVPRVSASCASLSVALLSAILISLQSAFRWRGAMSPRFKSPRHMKTQYREGGR